MKKNPLTNKKYVQIERFCKNCGNQVYKTDVKGYPFVCLKCDENRFYVETFEKEKKLDRVAYKTFQDLLKRASYGNLLTMQVIIAKRIKENKGEN